MTRLKERDVEKGTRHGCGHKELVLGEGKLSRKLFDDIVFDSFESRNIGGEWSL